MTDDRILYCIENQSSEGMDYGKHHYIFDEEFGHYCKFCFLPKEKANYKPIQKDKDGQFHYVEDLKA